MRGESYIVAVDALDDGDVLTDGIVTLVPTADVEKIARNSGRDAIGPGFGKNLKPHVRGTRRMLDQIIADGPCDLNTWEPAYGRLAEAQVKWEAAHGRPLAADT
jgi:tRNA threonylcarbamoyladenosine biosynthesis protein TsaB